MIGFEPIQNIKLYIGLKWTIDIERLVTHHLHFALWWFPAQQGGKCQQVAHLYECIIFKNTLEFNSDSAVWQLLLSTVFQQAWNGWFGMLCTDKLRKNWLYIYMNF